MYDKRFIPLLWTAILVVVSVVSANHWGFISHDMASLLFFLSGFALSCACFVVVGASVGGPVGLLSIGISMPTLLLVEINLLWPGTLAVIILLGWVFLIRWNAGRLRRATT